MREDRIQHDLIMWFGQTWPEYRELLYMVHNETISKAQGSHLKSMGLIAGVSDLIFIDPNSGIVSGIELKAPGSIHPSEHIKRQLAWGEKIRNSGGHYLITSELKDVKDYITSIINVTTEHLIIEHGSFIFIKTQLHKKTIKF